MTKTNNDSLTALVTGASSGIGKAAAHRLSREGMRLAITARSRDKLQLTSEEIRKNGGECLVLTADLSREEDIERVISETVDTFGGLDVLVNCAGIIGNGSVETTSLAEWDVMMNINLRSFFYLMNRAIPYLQKRPGSIVNVSSVTGLRAFPGILAYCVSKAGVDQLTRCAALELAEKGIRVNAINPGVVRTNLHRNGGMDEKVYQSFLEHSKTTHPLGRIGEPEEAAELIAFLATPRSSWITGTCISIDGGRAQTCAR